MTDPTWPWADSHQSSDWPWLRNVSTSQTLAKGDDYQLSGRSGHVLSFEECLFASKEHQFGLQLIVYFQWVFG